ncbi:hypothetical protein [Microscilla marina]|uniref:STAS/SEC14 domain-containing protein n=1 Tax=Microscilla marina ATCC 23134 TaxID=313606 RepID=A1ZGD9_MICM2|nr:hypothetical protein [Microscilla marina]EAY30556.1 hypothetical protein M23134_03194 [Microscilla marina ATCC 23134]
MVELEYKSEFLEVSYDSENSWVISRWTPNTRHLTIDRYKPEVVALRQIFVDHHSFAGSLSLTQDFHFVIDPILQQWVVQQFTDYMPPKSAVVVAAEFVSQLSIEQTVQDLDTAVKYFASQSEAEDWLLGKAS